MRTWKRPYNFTPRGNVGRWYEIKNMSADTAEVAIYDEIGLWGVTASDFVKDLGSVTTANLNIRINSPGGDVFDGLAILNALRAHPAHKTVTVDGLAASAASFIAMAGDKVVMSPQSMMMVHDAQGLAIGDARDMRSLADLLDKTSDNIASVYAARSGRPVSEWREIMLAETWYTDQEAVDAGLADEVLTKGPSDKTPEPVAAKATVTPVAQVVTWDDLDLDLEAIQTALKGANRNG